MTKQATCIAQFQQQVFVLSQMFDF